MVRLWALSSARIQPPAGAKSEIAVDAEPGARGVEGLDAWDVGCHDLAMSAASLSVDSSVISAGGSPAGSETELPMVCSDGKRGLTDLPIDALGALRTVALALGVDILLLAVLPEEVNALPSAATGGTSSPGPIPAEGVGAT